MAASAHRPATFRARPRPRPLAADQPLPPDVPSAVTATYTPKRDEALFRLDGDLLVPGPLTRGPWYEGTLHGSAMLAAVARAAEQHPSDVPRQVVRLTVDMVRAAPMAPLRVVTSSPRAGKRTDLVDIALLAGDELCVRATALRFRTTELVVDDAGFADSFLGARQPVPQAPGPDAVPVLLDDRPGLEHPAFHHAVDILPSVADDVVWFRLAVPVVEGEPSSGFVTVAAIADWTYAAPYLLHRAAGADVSTTALAVSAINVDTTVNVHRPLAGPWLGLRTTTRAGSLGAASSCGHLFDEQGGLGSTSQSILLRRAA